MKSVKESWKAILPGLLLVFTFMGGNHAFAQGGTWETKTPMPTPRSGAAVGAINGKLHVVAGFNTDSISVHEVYDPAIDSWSSAAASPTARNQMASGVIDGKLHVVGGTNPGGHQAVHEVYDPNTNTWATLAPMLHSRTGAVSGAIGGKLFVAGGIGDFQGCQSNCLAAFNSLEVYDPSTNTWTLLANMSNQRYGAAGGVINGKLYVVGGLTATGTIQSSLEVYDPVTNTWTLMTQMPTARFLGGSAVINGKLYVAGGSNGSVLNTLEVYDAQTDTWATLSPITPMTARNGLGADQIDGALFAVGGSDATGALAILEVFKTCATSGTASGHNWSMKYSACGNEGLVLMDVTLGNRLLARQMSLPYYRVLDTHGVLLARCELEVAADAGTPCGSQLRDGSVVVNKSATTLMLTAIYDIENLPGFPGTQLTIVQHYEFQREAGAICEPTETLPCARWQPLVSYHFVPPPGENFDGGINTVQRFEFDVDAMGTNAAALFEDALVFKGLTGGRPIPIPLFSIVKPLNGNPLSREVSAVAIRNGKAGKVDNFHQTSQSVIDEPEIVRLRGPKGIEIITPGCPECAHIHWRWGDSLRHVFPTFFGANGSGHPIIRAGSNQDVKVAVTRFHPEETHPDDYTKLIDGESLLGQAPVFWYSAFGHQPADTFFLHGGFFVSEP